MVCTIHLVESRFSVWCCWEVFESLRDEAQWEVVKSLLGVPPSEGIEVILMGSSLVPMSCYKKLRLNPPCSLACCLPMRSLPLTHASSMMPSLIVTQPKGPPEMSTCQHQALGQPKLGAK
jgi:hypothetical protein